MSISDEIERQTILTVLSKPISRVQFLLGKLLGILVPAAGISILLSVVFLVLISVKVHQDAFERPTPVEFLESMSGTCQELLELLDDRLREVALLRLQGFSNEEIAGQIGRSVKSVERYLKAIREVWDQDAG